MNLTVSIFTGGSTDTKAQRIDMPWTQLVQNLLNPPASLQAAVKEDLPLFKLGTFIGDTRKLGSPGPDFIWGVECDYDGERVGIHQAAQALKDSGILCVLATTARHRPDAPRWRIFAPLSGRTPIGERARLVGRINGALGGILANESFEPLRCYFIGKLAGADDYESVAVPGEPVDTLPELDAKAVIADPDLHKVERVDADRAFTLATAKMRWPGERALTVRALNAISADCDYKVWMRVGAALYSASGGEALDEFDEWSQTSASKYPGREAIEEKWLELGRMSAIKAGTIFWLAREAGWDRQAAQREIEREQRAEAATIGEGDDQRAPEINADTVLKELIYIAEGMRVAPRAAPWKSLPFAEMRGLMAGSVAWVGEGKKAKPKKVLDIWLEHPDRLTVHTDTFAPGQPEFCRNPDDIDAINLWRPRAAAQADSDLARPFFDHIAYLVPDAAERKRFVQWLAHIEQRPQELPQAHYLMVARQTGIGRNWLGNATARIWRGNVALGVDLVGLLEGSFNGQLSRKVLAIVDEIHEGNIQGSKQRVANRLKSMLTEETRLINPKYGRQRTEFNCCRWLMFSNHDAALPLGENDRRVFVIENPEQRKGPEYYTRLYGLLRQPRFIEAVRAELAAVDISDFNPGEIAALNDAKKRVIEAGFSDFAQALREMIATWPVDVVTATQVRRHISSFCSIPMDKVLRFNREADELGLRPLARIKVGGTVERVWSLRNHEAWVHRANAHLADEVTKAELFE